MIGYWATLSLNMPDFTRFGRSQREQIVGQVVALPTTMAVFAAMGVLITSATVVIYGEAIWDPVKLVGRFETPLVVAHLDVHGGRRDARGQHRRQRRLAGQRLRQRVPAADRLQDRRPDHRHPGILMQPWKLLADPSGYIFTWLLGYSGGLGSIAGVLIADYWLVRRTAVRLEDLYLPDGAYRYASGWNPPPSIATLSACALAWGGLVVPVLKPLYNYAWFVGFGVAMSVCATAMTAATGNATHESR